MESAFGRCLSSPLFTFTVGASKKEITVHSSALAGLSPSLNALMNGEMIEAKTRHVDWSEVDVDTFVRLCEFAYFRNYTPPTFRLVDGRSPMEAIQPPKGKRKPKKGRLSAKSDEPMPEHPAEPEPEPEPEPATPTEESTDYTIYNDPEIPYTERSIRTEQLRDTFNRRLVILAQSDNNTFAPPENTGSWEDFTPVFVGQAKLYVLADKYGIESLRQLILSKLRQTLGSFKLYTTGVTGIIEFVRFVYLNTPPNYGNQVDAMRNLVTRYIVSVLGQIGDSECFQDLLEDGGPFVSDLWHTVWSTDGVRVM